MSYVMRYVLRDEIDTDEVRRRAICQMWTDAEADARIAASENPGLARRYAANCRTIIREFCRVNQARLTHSPSVTAMRDR